MLVGIIALLVMQGWDRSRIPFANDMTLMEEYPEFAAVSAAMIAAGVIWLAFIGYAIVQARAARRRRRLERQRFGLLG